MDQICRYASPLGGITLAGDGEALVGLWFDGQKHFAAGLNGLTENEALPVFAQARRWLDAYFSGEAPDHTPPLRPRGTPFQLAVWRLLTEIPYGQTVTYGALAARLHRPGAAQAVGGAVGRNPLSLMIPCHRVVAADGGLTGYAGGLERKRWLLALEAGGQESLPPFFPPKSVK